MSPPIGLAPADYTASQKDEWDKLTREQWVTDNIHGHGSLGDAYPTNVWRGPTDNNFSRNNGNGVKEGDTPSWFYFLPNGLNSPDNPGFGGWGSRYEAVGNDTSHYAPAADAHQTAPNDRVLGQVWTVARWREAYQRDFQARMDWTDPTAPDNHAPISPLGMYDFSSISVEAGSLIELSPEGWSDPDGDPLTYRWWYYAEASNYDGPLNFQQIDEMLRLEAPLVDEQATLHLILEATDRPNQGVPLTRYQRFLVQVQPTVIPEPVSSVLFMTGLLAVLSRRVN